MKTYNHFLNELAENKLKYAAYDWDDNILNMPTKIHLQKKENDKFISVDISTDEFVNYRNKISQNPKEGEYRIYDNDIAKTYANFGDNDLFIKETKEGLDKKSYGPAFYNFINTLINGEIFAIITARSVSPLTLKKSVEIIIYDYLSESQHHQMLENLMDYSDLFGTNPDSLIEHYLEKCDYYPVNSKEFISRHEGNVDPANPEIGKKIALNEFSKRIEQYGLQTNRNVKLGFSDDDTVNINAITKHFNEINDIYNINYYVFDTSNNDKNNIIKTKI